MISHQGVTNSSGAPANRSGSPASSSNTCASAGCHSGGSVTNQTITISSTIPATGYQANTTYTVTVAANNMNSMTTGTIGFTASVEDATGHVGTLSSAGSGAQISGSFATHTFSGLSASMGTRSWTFDWNSGANPPANASVYAAVNFANADGWTAGDIIGSQSQTYSLMQTVVVSSPCAKPFFSEYIEGSGNNKGFEIYNPTGAPLDLGPYKIYLSGNGGSFSNTFDPMAIIAAGDVYTVTTDQADPLMQAEADTVFGFPSIAHFNGDDALFLVDTVLNDTVDIVGVVGVDPGSSWAVGTGSTQNHTLVRDTTINMGEKDWTVAAAQWDVFPINSFNYLGTHVSNCIAAPCSTPFFSEYIEGSGNNKGFEIYNPTMSALDLSPYKVFVSGNGGSFINSFDLTGMLASGDVYTLATNQSDPIMQAAADSVVGFPSVVHFNGDDAVILMDTVTGDTLDIIGVVGIDPGSSWPVGSGSTQNFTLVRMPSVVRGQKDWAIGATEWIVNPINTYTFYGSHVGNCVNTTPLNPTVNLDLSGQTVREDIGSVVVTININPVSATADTISMMLTPGVNLLPTDGSVIPLPNVITGLVDLIVPAGADSTGFTLTIVDDAILEGNETLFVSIAGVSNGFVIGMMDSAEWIIEDNDQIIPLYNIAQVRGVDADFIPDSLGVECKLIGTVFTDDFDGNAGYSFYMYDNTGAINVFNFVDEPGGYQVNRGDSIRVIGTIAFFNGLTELLIDSIAVLGSGVSLRQPTQVYDLNENTEGDYIRLNGFYLVDPTTWPIFAGSSVNMEITNGRDTVVMRIDSDTDIDGTLAPTGYFDIIGAGGQFDGSVPHDGGYQIFPRDSTDIIPIDLAEVYITEVMPTSNLSAPVDGDWFEIRNASTTTPIDLQGFSWDDNSRAAGTHTVTMSVSVPAGGTALFVEVDDADVLAWETEWKQNGQGLIILNEASEFDNGFSGLSAGGDEVNLYDDEGRLVSWVAYAGADITAGFSLEYDMMGMLSGSSVDGTNGAYTSTGGDVGSPGNQSAIGLEELLNSNLTIYPNPSNGAFTIASSTNDLKTIEITDLNGAVVYRGVSSDAHVNLDLAAYAAGIYLVKVSTEGQEVTRKMVLR
jgi:hypothetical protein